MSDTQPVIPDLVPEPRQDAPSQNGTAPEVFSSKSKTIGKLAAALAAAQLKFEPVFKDTENPYYRSRYADLAAVIKATQHALAENGLVVIQTPVIDLERQKAGVKTVLAHSSDEYLSVDLILPAVMQGRDGTVRFDAQSVGSALTYARRYAYQAIVGVAAEVDDDANSAVGIGSKEAQAKVVEKKMAAHARGEATPSLFYTWFNESQTAQISGSEELVKANRDLLAQFWNKTSKTIVVTGEQLEDLKFELGNRGVQFTHLKTTEPEKK